MNNHENYARSLKEEGNNCSKSLYTAFKESIDLGDSYPAPRSIEGKCGALLTALYILEKTGHGDKKEEFEKEFVETFGYAKCVDLMRHERRCTDYVGVCARRIDDILNI